MGEPEKVGTRGAKKTPTPAMQCSECYREADRAEQRGERRPHVQNVRVWIHGTIEYTGALCRGHSEVEHCWRYQHARKRFAGVQETLATLEQQHGRWLEMHKQTCRCTRALEGTPEGLLSTERLSEFEATLGLHACSGQCGRLLVRGVGKCWECRRAAETPQRADING